MSSDHTIYLRVVGRRRVRKVRTHRLSDSSQYRSGRQSSNQTLTGTKAPRQITRRYPVRASLLKRHLINNPSAQPKEVAIMADILVGDGVQYHGSQVEYHGLYVVVGEEPNIGRYILASVDNPEDVLYHVRPVSFDVLLSVAALT